MKQLFVLLIATTLFVGCKNEKAEDAKDVADGSETAATYAVDAESSTIEWMGSKPTGDNHTGTIALSDGTFQVENGAIVSGTTTIDMTSITVTDLEGEKKDWLEGHLKGMTDDEEKNGHFFSVKEFPTGKFEVTSFSSENGLEGNLTLKGITKSVKVPVSVTEADDVLTITSEKFTINRTDWDIKFSSGSFFKDLAADKIIKDEIELSLKVVAKKQ